MNEEIDKLRNTLTEIKSGVSRMENMLDALQPRKDSCFSLLDPSYYASGFVAFGGIISLGFYMFFVFMVICIANSVYLTNTVEKMGYEIYIPNELNLVDIKKAYKEVRDNYEALQKGTYSSMFLYPKRKIYPPMHSPSTYEELENMATSQPRRSQFRADQ